MRSPDNERRPRRAAEGDEKITGGRSTVESTELDAILHRTDHALVVLRGLRNGGTRRRVFYSLSSAQSALARAEAAGVPASVHLVRLVPVPFVALDELDGGVQR